MTRLLRASTLIGNPVVTLAGESPLEVKDVVFDTTSGTILGFNLRRHGLLGGPVDETLAWNDVHGLGPDAVMVADEKVLTVDGLEATIPDDAPEGNVLGNQVTTESGTNLGEVVEVVVSAGTRAEVVGFEIDPTALPGGDGTHRFVPLPDTLAISGEHIVVPDAATDFIRDDLAGFGSAVDEFRSKLGRGGS